jgi:hypothetical protein
MTAGFAAHGQNLVPNGNFNLNSTGVQAEPNPVPPFAGVGTGLGSFFDWSTTGTFSGQSVAYETSAPYIVTPAYQYGGLYPYYAQLSGSASDNIQQSITTISGDKYQVTFWLSDTPGLAGLIPADNTATFDATFGATTLLNLTPGTDSTYVSGGINGWTKTTLQITGTGAPTLLDFVFANQYGDWNLSDVSVVDVTASVSASVPDSGVGFGLIAATLLGLCGISRNINRRPVLA